MIEWRAMEPPSAILWDPPEIEVLDGEEHPKVSPFRRHAIVQATLARVLEDCADSRGDVGTEWRCVPGPQPGMPTEFVPDVSFFSAQRLDRLSEAQREKPPFSPDVTIEVRSPSTDVPFLRRKIARYLETGSLLVLDVDPAERTIVAHAAGCDARRYTQSDRFAHPAVDWLCFPVAGAFAKLDRR